MPISPEPVLWTQQAPFTIGIADDDKRTASFSSLGVVWNRNVELYSWRRNRYAAPSDRLSDSTTRTMRSKVAIWQQVPVAVLLPISQRSSNCWYSTPLAR